MKAALRRGPLDWKKKCRWLREEVEIGREETEHPSLEDAMVDPKSSDVWGDYGDYAGWADWNGWDVDSVTCGDGETSRSRASSGQPQRGGVDSADQHFTPKMALENAWLQDQIKETDRRNSWLRDENESLQGYVKKMDNLNSQLADENETIQKQLKKMGLWNCSLQDQNESLQRQNESLQDQLRELSESLKESEKLRAEISNLKTEKALLAQLLDSRFQVDEERWQFQGDTDQWVSFPMP